MAGRAGLIAAVKTVTRGGKTFSQRYWVKSSDIKARGRKEALGLVGGAASAQRAEHMIDGWMNSSTEAGAISMRAGAAQALTPAEIAEERADIAALGGDVVQFDRAVANRNNARELRTMQRVASAYHEEEELGVFRGVGPEQAAQIRAAFDAGAETVSVDVGTLSSFTESGAVARRFATRNDRHGAVIGMNVRRAGIVWSHRVRDSGLLASEEEVVVYTRGSITIRRENVVYH